MIGDLQRVLAWTSADEHFVDRVTARMEPDRRTALKAIIETRGDVRALAQRLAPDVLARLQARTQRRGEALNALTAPLFEAWSAPAGSRSAEDIAQRFFERYAVRLDDLTGRATKAAAAAKGAAAALRSVAGARDLADAATGLASAIDEVEAAAVACSHPEGATWADHARDVAREGMDVVDVARSVQTVASSLRTQVETVERALREWSDAPPAVQAATAEAMAVRVRAAASAVSDMLDQLMSPAR